MAPPVIDLRLQNSTPKEDTDTHTQPERKLANGTVLLEWDAAEYVVYEKSAGWYMAFGIILALLLFAAFLLKSFLSGVVFLLSGILIFLHSERPPRQVHYEIRNTGIVVGERIYLYRELQHFNVVEKGHDVYMLLHSRRLIVPIIHVPIGSADPLDVQRLVGAHLPHDDQFVEPFADVLAHWLGF